MKQYRKRTYRHRLSGLDLMCYELRVKETDLLIRTSKPLRKQALDLVYEVREQLESYIERNPIFLTSLTPLARDPFAPWVVRQMIEAGIKAGVGPMAAVAGAVAEFVGRGLLQYSEEVVVENGGDIFMKVGRPLRVGMFAGRSLLSNRLAVSIKAEETPLGVCSSSGTIGHSLSQGKADLACVLAKSAALADAAATALGNRVKTKGHVNQALDWVQGIEGVLGAVIIIEESVGVWGRVNLEKVS